MKPRRLLSPLLVLACVSAGLPAIAEPDPRFDESVKRFNEGKELLRQRKFAEAHVKFVQSCAAFRTKNCPKNLGVTEYELGMFADAATHLEEYVADEGSRGDPHLPNIRKLLEQSLLKCGHVTVDAPAGSTIAVDEQPIGKAPLAGPVHMMPGTHSVHAALPSGTMLATTVSVEAGKPTKATLKVPESTPAPPAASSSAAPPPPAPTARDVAPPPPITTPTESFWTTRRWIGVGVAAVGVIGIGVGTYFGGQSNDAADRANALQASVGKSGCGVSTQQCADLQDAHDTANRDHTLSIVFMSAGIVALASGAALLLWPRSNPSQTAVVPMISPSAAGLQLHGAF